MSQITATARALSRAFSRATRATQTGYAIDARAWFREPRIYGVPQSKAEVAADRVRYDIKSLESYFKCALAKDESMNLMIPIQLTGRAQLKLCSAA